MSASVKNMGGGMPLERTLLWTNPNPNSAMGEITFTTPSFKDFDYIEIEAYRGVNDLVIVDFIESNFTGQWQTERQMFGCVYVGGNGGFYTRTFRAGNSDFTQMNIGVAVQVSTSNQNSNAVIPIRVYGIKGKIE